MKDFKNVLERVADALKSFAEGVTTIAEEIEAFSKSHAATEPQTPPPDEKPAEKIPKAAKKKPAPQVAAVKNSTKKTSTKASTEKKAPLTAVGTVFQLINDAPDGIDAGTLMGKTGFDKKKVSNIIHKLKQQGKIESPKRGIYAKK